MDIESDKSLLYKRENIWSRLDDKQKNEAYKLSKEYMEFISHAKTERVAIEYAIEMAKENGFRENTEFQTLKPGDKVFFVNRKKNILLAVIGTTSFQERSHLVAAHIDSPRIDLKANPVYEDTDLVLLKTHYYGGLKKYHWVNIPLEMHGVMVKKDGTVIDVHIGDKDEDPVFVISDVLPHIGTKMQNERKIPDLIKGEELNVLAGSLPIDTELECKYKLNFLRILNQKYNVTESDFLSAELSLVPAMNARFVGLDKGMVGGYGQDDRICSYLSLRSILNLNDPKLTGLCFLADKEETGSDSNTGAQSQWLVYTVNEILEKLHVNSLPTSYLHQVFSNMRILSSDVNAAINPTYKNIHEPMNAGKIGFGPIVTKFSGGGGKGSTNDAHAEFIGYLRALFDNSGVFWQMGEWGKVDEGGAGTIAKFLAKYNAEVIDMGPGLIGMHSTFELSHIADIYATLHAYEVFLSAQQ